ncbi:MAG: hypothetical protein CSA81_03835 [Acidobacteria bacterium]|nr:MAG: hypothetical protein CSA81_03835 [Acidobacteriota bacterium]
MLLQRQAITASWSYFASGCQDRSAAYQNGLQAMAIQNRLPTGVKGPLTWARIPIGSHRLFFTGKHEWFLSRGDSMNRPALNT